VDPLHPETPIAVPISVQVQPAVTAQVGTMPADANQTIILNESGNLIDLRTGKAVQNLALASELKFLRKNGDEELYWVKYQDNFESLFSSKNGSSQASHSPFEFLSNDWLYQNDGRDVTFYDIRNGEPLLRLLHGIQL